MQLLSPCLSFWRSLCPAGLPAHPACGIQPICGRRLTASTVSLCLPLTFQRTLPDGLGFCGRSKALTIHETANTSEGADAEAHSDYLSTTSDEVSWHYTVDDHQIYQHLPDNEEAWHSGDREGNHSSIGIELCVNADGNFDQTMENAAKLTAFLLKEYDLTIDDVKQHYDFNGKDCPLIIRQEGRWDEFLGMVQQNL